MDKNKQIKKHFEDLKALFKEFNKTKCKECGKGKVKIKQLVSGVYAEKIKYKIGICCKGCASYRGHFNQYYSGYNKYLSKKEIAKRKRQYGFSKVFGFFDKKKLKCKLPYSKRSYNCLIWCCNENLKSQAKTIVNKIIKLRA